MNFLDRKIQTQFVSSNPINWELDVLFYQHGQTSLYSWNCFIMFNKKSNNHYLQTTANIMKSRPIFFEYSSFKQKAIKICLTFFQITSEMTENVPRIVLDVPQLKPQGGRMVELLLAVVNCF